jgi:D-alanyl-D-alanine carboxypeptidase
MKSYLNSKFKIPGFLLFLSLVLLLPACKGPSTDKKETSIQEEILQPLPDSLKIYLDSTIRNMAIENKIRMLIKVEKDGEMASYAGYDGRAQKPISDFNVPYEIGSTTKMFTASAILQLVEQGKFDLDTPFMNILTKDTLYQGLAVVDGIDYIDSIKVLNLLNHTSGMPDYFIHGSDEEEIAENGDASLVFGLNDLISLSKKSSKARFVPGSKFEYSNINYIFLGRIIEKVSGKSYADYIQEHILDPLNLDETYFGSKNAPANMAQGHFKGSDSEMPYTMAGSAGEIISTLDDMIAFIDGWYDGKLFDRKETLDMVKNDHFVDMEISLSYGLGCIEMLGQSLGHAGQSFGFQSYSAALPNGYRFTLYTDDAAISVWAPAILYTSKLSREN